MPTAIITGAGSGVGRAAALELSRRGFTVALVGRTKSTLEKTAGEIRATGGQAIPIAADVSLAQECQKMVRRAADLLGRIDALINNAGAVAVLPLAQLTDEQWQENLGANLSSVFFTTRAVWPIMEQQHLASVTAGKTSAAGGLASGGIIVNISSMATRDPFPGLGAYAAAKMGVNMLTLVTAREGHAVGIRAICLAPGAVDTPMFRGFMRDQPFSAADVMEPADVATVIADAVTGTLRFASGETVFLHKRPA